MRKIVIGALVVVAIGAAAALFFSTAEVNPNATPCERDCINDSGGLVFCKKYCAENGSYGPQKK